MGIIFKLAVPAPLAAPAGPPDVRVHQTASITTAPLRRAAYGSVPGIRPMDPSA